MYVSETEFRFTTAAMKHHPRELLKGVAYETSVVVSYQVSLGKKRVKIR